MQTVFARHTAVERVILYGSRALGTHRNGSDIDLAVSGNQLTFSKLLDLLIDLDKLELLYTFDIQNLQTISNSDLLNHIHRVGVLIYQSPVIATA